MLVVAMALRGIAGFCFGAAGCSVLYGLATERLEFAFHAGIWTVAGGAISWAVSEALLGSAQASKALPAPPRVPPTAAPPRPAKARLRPSLVVAKVSKGIGVFFLACTAGVVVYGILTLNPAFSIANGLCNFIVGVLFWYAGVGIEASARTASPEIAAAPVTSPAPLTQTEPAPSLTPLNKPRRL